MQFADQLTEWFPITAGVRQGDSLSPILFTIYINDLVPQIQDLHAGVQVGGDELPILLYADDIVLLSGNVRKMQEQLNVMSDWCRKWRMAINVKKSQVGHVRNPQKPIDPRRHYTAVTDNWNMYLHTNIWVCLLMNMYHQHHPLTP